MKVESIKEGIDEQISSSISQTADEIRAEVKKVSVESSNAYTFIESDISQGTFSDVDGEFVYSPYRLRTYKIPAKKDDIFSFTKGINCVYTRYAIYNEEGVFQNCSQWMTNTTSGGQINPVEFKMPYDGYVCYTFSYNPNAESVLDVDDYDATLIRIDSQIANLSSTISQTADRIQSEVSRVAVESANEITFSQSDIERGTFDSYGDFIDSTVRLRTYKIPAKKGDVFSFTNGSECKYAKRAVYNSNKVYQTQSNWITSTTSSGVAVPNEYTMPYDGYVCYTFTHDKVAESTLIVSDYDATLQKIDMAIKSISSTVSQYADKISWAITGDGTTTEFAMTPEALTYVGTNVNLDINNDFTVTVSNLTSAIGAKNNIWYTDTTPANHAVGDIWYDLDDDTIRRWNGTSWEDITDDALKSALDAAGTAKAIADGKIKTYAQTTQPTNTVADPLGIGDLWIDTDDNNKLYRWSGSSWLPYRDTHLDYLIDEIDGVTTTYYSSTTPTGAESGDIWYDTTHHKIKRYNGTSWTDITNEALYAALEAAGDAAATVDGKIVTFSQSSTPVATSIGDLWINTSTNKMHRWDGTTWNVFNDADISAAQETANNAITTIVNEIEPIVENVERWMNFGVDGLRQGKEGSPYSTLINESGYHIDKEGVAGHVGSFTADGLSTQGITIGSIAVKQTGNGGWVWVEV